MLLVSGLRQTWSLRTFHHDSCFREFNVQTVQSKKRKKKEKKMALETQRQKQTKKQTTAKTDETNTSTINSYNVSRLRWIW